MQGNTFASTQIPWHRALNPTGELKPQNPRIRSMQLGLSDATSTWREAWQRLRHSHLGTSRLYQMGLGWGSLCHQLQEAVSPASRPLAVQRGCASSSHTQQVKGGGTCPGCPAEGPMSSRQSQGAQLQQEPFFIVKTRQEVGLGWRDLFWGQSQGSATDHRMHRIVPKDKELSGPKGQ